MRFSVLVGNYVFKRCFKLIGSTGLHLLAGRPVLSVFTPGNKEQFWITGPEIKLKDY